MVVALNRINKMYVLQLGKELPKKVFGMDIITLGPGVMQTTFFYMCNTITVVVPQSYNIPNRC